MQKKILGVLGGMGPAASARFYTLLTEFTAAEKDSDHMEILLHSLPTIPDRTEFILGRSKSSPLPMMESAVLRLAQNGAQIIALPCNTAEYFYSPLKAICPVPILRAAKESARIAKVRGVKKLGVLATEGAINAKIYQNQLALLGIDLSVPCKSTQTEITALIYSHIKKSRPFESTVLERAAYELMSAGCDAAVLGCTELSLAAPENDSFFIDSLSVLAAKCVLSCGYELSEKGKPHAT
jgi:aspartate racemase